MVLSLTSTWACCALLATQILAAQQVRVIYVSGTLGLPQNTAGRLNYEDKRECRIAWSSGKSETQFPYDGVAFVERGNLHITGTYEVVSMVDKWLNFLTIVYTDDFGNSNILEIQLKSGAEDFLQLLSMRAHADIRRRVASGADLGSSLQYSLVDNSRRVLLSSRTEDGPTRFHGFLRTSRDGDLSLEGPAGTLRIPYRQITSIEYGEKITRRVGMAIMMSVLVMDELPFFIMRKRNRHFVTIGFRDTQAEPQWLVIEVPKYTARALILELEIRTRKAVKYQTQKAVENVYG